MSCIQPGYDYFENRFEVGGNARVNFTAQRSTFEGAALFHPHTVQGMATHTAMAKIDKLATFPAIVNAFDRTGIQRYTHTISHTSKVRLLFCHVRCVHRLKDDYAVYHAVAVLATDPDLDVLAWYKRNQNKIGVWAECFKLVALICPSSAAAERVFSMMRRTFGDQQTASLMDLVETSLMLQYNNRKEKK